MKTIIILLIINLSPVFLLAQKITYEISLNSTISFPKVQYQPKEELPPSGSSVVFSTLENSKEYRDKISLKPGFTIGGIAKFRINDNIDIISGIDFSLLRFGLKDESYKSFLEDDAPEFGINTDLFYASIPLGVNFRFTRNSKLSFSLTAAADYLIHAKERLKIPVLDIVFVGIGDFDIVFNEDNKSFKNRSVLRKFNLSTKFSADYLLVDRVKVELFYNYKVFKLYSEDIYNSDESALNLSSIGLGTRILF